MWFRAVSKPESCLAWALVNSGPCLWPGSSPFCPAIRGKVSALLPESCDLPRAYLSAPGPQGPRFRSEHASLTFVNGAHRKQPFSTTSKWVPMSNSPLIVMDSQNGELGSLAEVWHPRLLTQALNVLTTEQTPGLIPWLTISVTRASLLKGSPLLKWFKFSIFSQ